MSSVSLAVTKANYNDLYKIPESMIGEIIDGELFAIPRPSPQHSNVVFELCGELWGPYKRGKDGSTGGWIFLIEPEIQFGEDILVPELAGWEKDKLSKPPEENFISVSPDWICEVLSYRTMRIDRIKKMPIYAKFHVSFLWLIDPLTKILEVFKLESNKWVLSCTAIEDDKFKAEPFEHIEINLKNLWWR